MAQQACRPDLPIIFFTSHTDVPMAVQAMKAGAVDFLVKPFNDAALLYVIGAAIERSRAALRHDSEMQVLRKRYSTLTPRERQVMALVVSGLLNKQVAGELGIHRPGHREGTRRPSHAQDEGRLAGRPSDDRRKARRTQAWSPRKHPPNRSTTQTARKGFNSCGR